MFLSESAVVTRQKQLSLTAKKKAKNPPKETAKEAAPPDEEEDAPEDAEKEPEEDDQPEVASGSKGKPKKGSMKRPAAAKAKAKAVPKSKAKAKASAAKLKLAESSKADEEDDDDDRDVRKGRAKSSKLVRKVSKRRLVAKGKKRPFKKLKKEKIAAERAGESAPTEYYDEAEAENDEENGEGEAPSVEPPSKRVRVRGKKNAAAEPEDEEPNAEEPNREEEEEPNPEEEEEEPEAVPTFARRYCPQRPWYKAKFLAIRDAFDARIRPFITSPCKNEDSVESTCTRAVYDSFIHVEFVVGACRITSGATWPRPPRTSRSRIWRIGRKWLRTSLLIS